MRAGLALVGAILLLSGCGDEQDESELDCEGGMMYARCETSADCGCTGHYDSMNRGGGGVEDLPLECHTLSQPDGSRAGLCTASCRGDSVQGNCELRINLPDVHASADLYAAGHCDETLQVCVPDQ